jgi:uncharacterized protein YecT (DUF1311 family)
MKTLLAFLLLCLSLPAFADSACDHPKNDFDGLYCLNKVWIEADHNLNTTYQKLNLKLDVAGKSALKKGQIEWMKSRNSSCSETKGDHFLVDLDCAAKTTIERTQFLEDRYRECVSAGCMNSKLE